MSIAKKIVTLAAAAAIAVPVFAQAPQGPGSGPGGMMGPGAGPGMMGPGGGAGPGYAQRGGRGYGPGYGPGYGGPGYGPGYYGMGPGMMGGYGPGYGYGMGPGMMGGYGPGYGMGPGMMGGMMGPGMMGGYGPGYGAGPGMMGGALWALDLTDKQVSEIAKIQDETRRKNWDVLGKMQDEYAKLRDAYATDKRDRPAIVAAYKRISDLRLQRIENSLEAREKVESVLTSEQREQLRRWGPWWMMGGTE